MSEPDGTQAENKLSPQTDQELATSSTAPVQETDPLQGLERWVKEDAPPEIRSRLRSIEQVARISYTGPLPLASEFAAYENAVPGAGDRILKMAERAQELDSDKIGVVRHRISATTLVSLATILLSAFAIWQGLTWPAVPLGLGGIITLFLREVTKLWSRNT